MILSIEFTRMHGHRDSDQNYCKKNNFHCIWCQLLRSFTNVPAKKRMVIGIIVILKTLFRSQHLEAHLMFPLTHISLNKTHWILCYLKFNKTNILSFEHMASIQKIENWNPSIFQIKIPNSLNKCTQQLFKHHWSSLSFLTEQRLASYCCILGKERSIGQVSLKGNVRHLRKSICRQLFSEKDVTWHQQNWRKRDTDCRLMAVLNSRITTAIVTTSSLPSAFGLLRLFSARKLQKQPKQLFQGLWKLLFLQT